MSKWVFESISLDPLRNRWCLTSQSSNNVHLSSLSLYNAGLKPSLCTYLNSITFWRKIAKRCKAYNTTQCWLLDPGAPKTREYAKVGPFKKLFGTKCSKTYFHSFYWSGGGQSCAGLFKCLLGLKWNGFYFPINDCRRKSFSAIKLLPSRLPAQIMRQSQTLKTSINRDAINWCSL